MQLIRQAGMRAFPLLSEEYAVKIARDWNVPAHGHGYVTRFRVARLFLDKYEVREVGGRRYREYWIPAEDLADLNAALIGQIEVIAEFS